MTQKEKRDFRYTSKWKRFRVKMKKLAQGIDFITMKPLTKAWNLHHLDMKDVNYKDITNPDRFIALNEDTHKIVHWLYPIYKKDKDVIARLEYILMLMETYTSDRTGKAKNKTRAELSK